ncbi:MAG: hypothetical protein AAB339_03830 [Elusimicrobiota bacterium]
MLLSPSKAAARLEEGDAALQDSLRIFLAYMASAVLFYTLKPAGFPPAGPDAPLPAPGQEGLVFWVKVQAWSPLLTALWVLLTGSFARLLTGGRLPMRLFAAGGAALLPLLWVLFYTNTPMPRWTLGAGLLALCAAAVPAVRAVPGPSWRAYASWLMAVNSAAIALLPLFACAVLSDSPLLYQSLEVALLFWTLGLATYGTSRIARIPAARAFCAVFLGLLCQVVFVYAFYLLGLLPKGVLKALMAA